MTEWIPRVKLPTVSQGRKARWNEDEGWGRKVSNKCRPPRHRGEGVTAGSDGLGFWWPRPASWPQPAGGSEPHASQLTMEQPYRPCFCDKPVPSQDVNPACVVCSTPVGNFVPYHCSVNQHTVLAVCPNFFLEGLRKEERVTETLLWEAMSLSPAISDSYGTQWRRVKTFPWLLHSNSTHTGWLREGLSCLTNPWMAPKMELHEKSQLSGLFDLRNAELIRDGPGFSVHHWSSWFCPLSPSHSDWIPISCHNFDFFVFTHNCR